MTERDHIQVREEQGNRHASPEDFHAIFSEHLNELYQLSFLLTRDPAKAERCLVSGIEDCVTGNRSFRGWARSWAKRTIVQNAVRELKPRPIHSNSPVSEPPSDFIVCSHSTLGALNTFNRFVTRPTHDLEPNARNSTT
jgi:hypothetical protein